MRLNPHLAALDVALADLTPDEIDMLEVACRSRRRLRNWPAPGVVGCLLEVLRTDWPAAPHGADSIGRHARRDDG